MNFAVLATGPSLTQADCDYLRGKCGVVAVSNAIQLAPWADALVSADTDWWRLHKPAFAGPKFGITAEWHGVQKVDLPAMSNSGLLGMRVAEMLGATRILLLGFDMKGTHFFGQHPAPLQNTPSHRFDVFKRQFNGWHGVPVVNCTPDSALECFPCARLNEVL